MTTCIGATFNPPPLENESTLHHPSFMFGIFVAVAFVGICMLLRIAYVAYARGSYQKL